MKLLRFYILFLLFIPSTGELNAQSKFQKDFDDYWLTIKNNFAYFDIQKTNWDQVKEIYQAQADTVKTEEAFIHLLEATNNELYNGHVFLNTNTKSSNRTNPTGTDLKVEYLQSKFVITEVREYFNAGLCGLKKGMVITKFNDIAMKEAIQTMLPKSVEKHDDRMYAFAATTLLAGTHDKERKITVLWNGKEQDFYPDNIPNKTESNYHTLLETNFFTGNIGYIKINNSLGNSDLIQEFDKALDGLMQSDGLILDLRETPSGGTTTIARAILGRFMAIERPYQKHLYVIEEKETGIARSTFELVSPRPAHYAKPVIVLVGYWTGSMGEGMAVAFEGMLRARVMGTKMAGLLGEIETFETKELKIPFSFPTVQLQTVHGIPREEFKPMPLEGDLIEEARKLLVVKHRPAPKMISR